MRKFYDYVIVPVCISIVIIGCVGLGYGLEDRVSSSKIETSSYEYLKSMTVRLEFRALFYGWVGTGTIVKITDDYTYILTNKHVAPISSSGQQVELFGETLDVGLLVVDDKTYVSEVIKISKYFDLSLIKIVGKIPNKTKIKGIRNTNVQDKVYSVGMYRGLEDIYTEGTISGYYEHDENVGSVVANLPSAGGCSGSGVFDENGYLTAVLWGGFKDDEDATDNAKAILVPTEAVRDFLEGII